MVPNERRFFSYLARVLGARESQRGAAAVSDLVPSLPVLDPASAELLAVRGEMPCSGYALRTPAAGNSLFFTLFNPAGSGIIAVVDEVVFGAAAAGAVNWSFDSIAGTNLLSNSCITDQRATGIGAPGSPKPVCKTYWDDVVGVGGALSGGRILIGANASVVVRPRAVLPPGKGFTIAMETINVACTAWFLWRERATVDEMRLA